MGIRGGGGEGLVLCKNMSSLCQRLQLFFFFSLQVIYLGIVGATYYLIVKSCFSYIPGYYLSEVHRLFFLVSFPL